MGMALFATAHNNVAAASAHCPDFFGKVIYRGMASCCCYKQHRGSFHHNLFDIPLLEVGKTGDSNGHGEESEVISIPLLAHFATARNNVAAVAVHCPDFLAVLHMG